VLPPENTNVRLSYVPTKEENDTYNYFKNLQQELTIDLYDQDPKVREM
jgi:hypothetical protein